jgi:hypothetical protein
MSSKRDRFAPSDSVAARVAAALGIDLTNVNRLTVHMAAGEPTRVEVEHICRNDAQEAIARAFEEHP